METASRRPRILIIYTGGTIGMIEDPETGTLSPFDFSHLIDNVPKIKMLDYDIEHLQFDPPIDSSNIAPSHWQQIASEIGRNYNDFDGFVVLHGTDTMAYTASALSFMLDHRLPASHRGSADRRRRKPDYRPADCSRNRPCKRRAYGAGGGHIVRKLSMAWQPLYKNER